ncbi:LysR family transcriptional regulator [Paeniglutamicibacter sp. R2-26]|uniref:LysR family transcriptional regulator n=1 Tax=Paeniglutamicibacter sp. R2-26 TaxID=3144417 RepID=UPI003EE4F6AC
MSGPGFSLTQLRYFVTACETLNTARAAELLRVSQSSISTAVLHLESEMGVTLFLRVPAKGLRLTDDGREVRRIAADLLARSEELSRFSNASRMLVAGTVRIACYPTLIPTFFPPLYKRISETYPHLRVELVDSSYSGVLQRLRAADVTFGLLYDDGIPVDLEVEYIASCRPYLLVSEHHRLAHRDSVGFEELDGEQLVQLDLATSREYVHQVLRRAGARVEQVCETTSMEALRGVVATSNAFAILNQLPRHDYAIGGEKVSAVPLRGDIEIPRIALVQRPTEVVSAKINAIKNAIRAIGEEITAAQLHPPASPVP